MANQRFPNILVIGGAAPIEDVVVDFATLAGQFVAANGANLLTGGRTGVMEVASRAFRSTSGRAGRAIGVLPGEIPELPKGPEYLTQGGSYTYKPATPNEWVEIALRTHLPGRDPRGAESRNFINVLSADLVIAVAGGKGTQAELDIALAVGKPVIAFLGPDHRIGSCAPEDLLERVFMAPDLPALGSFARPILEKFLLPRPSFSDLLRGYSTEPTSVHRCSIHFPNTCAIRMSEALATSVPGVVDKFKTSGLNICPHGYMRGAQDLAAVLKRGDVFGIYNQGFSAPGQMPEAARGRKGIICYMNIPAYPDAQGHIDLWDGTRPVGDAYWSANPIWFWHLH